MFTWHSYGTRIYPTQVSPCLSNLAVVWHSWRCHGWWGRRAWGRRGEGQHKQLRRDIANKQTSSTVVQSTALTSLQLVFSWVSTCFRFAATLNMLLCLSLCIRVITSLVVNIPTSSLSTCTWIPCIFCRFSHCENGSFEVLSLHKQALWISAHIYPAMVRCRWRINTNPISHKYEPKTVSFKDIDAEAIEPEDLEPRRIELDRNLGTDPYQIHERCVRSSLTEDMDEFGKVGADVSYLQSQMRSEYDLAESIADSDLEDGEPRKMRASPLCLQNREDYESSRIPTAPVKPAASLQERGASAKRTQANFRKGSMSSSSQEPGASGKPAAMFS